nr:hypothetical protein [Tanacetum cinerariifolium]
LTVAVDDNWPPGQRVRVHRHDDNGVQFRVHDRPARRQRAATVDAEHRHVVLGQRTGGAEQAAVTADDDDHVADFAEHLARRGLHAVPRQHFGDGVFED